MPKNNLIEKALEVPKGNETKNNTRKLYNIWGWEWEDKDEKATVLT
jgi:hypothetical protein